MKKVLLSTCMAMAIGISAGYAQDAGEPVFPEEFIVKVFNEGLEVTQGDDWNTWTIKVEGEVAENTFSVVIDVPDGFEGFINAAWSDNEVIISENNPQGLRRITANDDLKDGSWITLDKLKENSYFDGEFVKGNRFTFEPTYVEGTFNYQTVEMYLYKGDMVWSTNINLEVYVSKATDSETPVFPKTLDVAVSNNEIDIWQGAADNLPEGTLTEDEVEFVLGMYPQSAIVLTGDASDTSAELSFTLPEGWSGVLPIKFKGMGEGEWMKTRSNPSDWMMVDEIKANYGMMGIFDTSIPEGTKIDFTMEEKQIYLCYLYTDIEMEGEKYSLADIANAFLVIVNPKNEDGGELEAANQAAYDAVIAQLDAIQAKYDDAVAEIKEINPDFDFSEWEEIGNMIEQYKGWAAQALAAANEEGAEFQFPFDSEEFDGYIQMMIMDGTPVPTSLDVTLNSYAGIDLNVDDSQGIFIIEVNGKSLEEEITITVDVPKGWDGLLYMNGDDYDPGIDPLSTRAQESEWWPVADLMQFAGFKEGNSLTFPVGKEPHSGQFLLVKDGWADAANQINVEFAVEYDFITANQAAFDKVMDEINAANSNYAEAVAFIEGFNPKFDLTEWKEIIGNAISEAQTGAENALIVANEEEEAFFFPFSAEEINAMIAEMRIQAVTASNQAVYEETLAKIEESEKEYKTTIDELTKENPDFDFKEWKELIEFVLNNAKKGAEKALDSANAEGTVYEYAFDGKEITALLDEMREEVKTSGIGSVNAADNADYYDLNGNKISNPKAGMYIKVVDGKATKVVVK